jgi:hypothetical protein
MVSAVSRTSALVPTSSNKANPTAVADKALKLLLQSPDMLSSLASQSSIYLPPTNKQILSTLWGMINTSGSRIITQSDLQQLIISEGGKISDARALWAQLNPNGKSTSTIDAQNFAFNQYLTKTISSNLASVQASVKQTQLQQGPSTSSSLLGLFIALGGSGSVISNTGSSSGNIFNFLA